MPAGHPDLASEQHYIERAYEAHLHARERLAKLPAGGADKFAMRELRSQVIQRLAQQVDPEQLCFGRIDAESGPTLYLGRDAIHAPDSTELLVISWRVPAAAPFFTASRDDPQGLARRRRFQLDQLHLRGIVDEVLQDGAPSVLPAAAEIQPTQAAPALVDAILADMDRARTSEMRDIIATIEAEQYRLISDSLDGVLVVQGGPGTGKTAIALHRAAWLLYNHRAQLERSRVLVVGPNRAFMEYVAKVLPSLGETAVDQFAVDRLGGGADLRVRARESDELARLKGDVRMAEVIQNAVWDRVRPASKPVSVRVRGGEHQIPAEVVNGVIDRARTAGLSYLAARDAFRSQFRAAAADYVAERARGFRAGASRTELTEDLGSRQPAIDRVWPALSAAEVIRELLDNRRQLERSSADILSDQERKHLWRERSRELRDEPWTVADIALLDEAQFALAADQKRYGYVIVDEAQDLTPMQLRVIARRSAHGRMTLVGDLAQATGAWRYRSWDELLAQLPASASSRVAELMLGYRVPSQVMELASRLVTRIADNLQIPRAIRLGPEDPHTIRAEEEELLEHVEAEVWRHADSERSIGVIAPRRVLPALHATLRNAGLPAGEVGADGLSERVTLLTAEESKGLEFDHVIVVDPAGIVTAEEDWAKLYVALTRTTQTLSIVHSTEEPIPSKVRRAEVRVQPVSSPERGRASAGDRLGSRYTEALMRAKFLHSSQQRRGTGVPYLAHLMAVSALVLEDGGTEDEAIAALLHDAVEDHGIESFDSIADQFGIEVAEIVAGCTDPDVGDGSWRDMKAQHLQALERAGARVRRVALAEKLDNARALLRDYRRVGPLLWEHMVVDPENLFWYLQALADLFAVERPGDMASELRDTVDRLLETVTKD